MMNMSYAARLGAAILLLTLFGAGCITITKLPDASSPSPSAATSTASGSEQRAPLVFTSDDRVTLVTVPASAFLGGRVTFKEPMTFSGTSTAFENQIAWSVKESDGTVLAQGNAYVSSSDTGIPGPFMITVKNIKTPKAKTGEFSVFEPSAKDGTPIHVVRVPLSF